MMPRNEHDFSGVSSLRQHRLRDLGELIVREAGFDWLVQHPGQRNDRLGRTITVLGPPGGYQQIRLGKVLGNHLGQGPRGSYPRFDRLGSLLSGFSSGFSA